MFLYGDSLTRATDALLESVMLVTKEVDKKKDVIRKAEIAIKEAQNAINEAKNSLSM